MGETLQLGYKFGVRQISYKNWFKYFPFPYEIWTESLQKIVYVKQLQTRKDFWVHLHLCLLTICSKIAGSRELK